MTKKIVLILLMILSVGKLNAQQYYNFDYKKVVLYLDSLLCNNKIYHYDGYDTTVFDVSNKKIYIKQNIKSPCLLYTSVAKIEDTIIHDDWISNLCNREVEFVNDNYRMSYLDEEIYISFCSDVYRDKQGYYFEINIRYQYHYNKESNDGWAGLVSLGDAIIIYIRDKDIIGYKCISLSD